MNKQMKRDGTPICAPQNPDKKQRTLEKTIAKLQRRQNNFVDKSSGGHECHKPGSMKMRKN